MGMLNDFKVLDALIRENNTRTKKGDEDPRATFTALLNRLLKENLGVKESSARPQTAKHLRNLRSDGYITREKIGRNVYYDVTPEGHLYHLTSRDNIDPDRRWFEEPIPGCYLSFAMAPLSSGLINERLDQDGLQGKEKVRELVRQIKELNPGLDSIFIRLDQAV